MKLRTIFWLGIGVTIATAGPSSGIAQDAHAQKVLPPLSQIPEWSDSMFKDPYVDIDEWRDAPVRHRYVHGGFKGTETRFSIYFPPTEHYEGRFFEKSAGGNENAFQQEEPQPNDPALQGNTSIGFAIASGAYLVESNDGVLETTNSSMDPQTYLVTGYRANAAIAQYSRVLAAKMYGPHRPYGYMYGHGGEALKTVCGFESTFNVWDGVLAVSYSTPMTIPNVFTVKSHAHRLLRNKWREVVDALDPGGSGDMYATLNADEREGLQEATQFGIPPRLWFSYSRLGYGNMAYLINTLVKLDPQYFEDFWKVPGYLGASRSASLQKDLIKPKAPTSITRIVMSDEGSKMGIPVPTLAHAGGVTSIVPSAILVKDLPKGDLTGASLIVKTGAAAGKVFSIRSMKGDLLVLGTDLSLRPYFVQLKAGDQVQIDNSIYLAAQTYHRHQVPTSDFHVWDQFRRADGTPIYPQRPRILGPDFLRFASGCTTQEGWFRFPGKMIMVAPVLHLSASPWHADWYRSQAKAKMGGHLDDAFRLWYNDNSMGEPVLGPDRTRAVDDETVSQQALRDLSAWVERGVAPPPSTTYKMVDNQLALPPTAAERGGIQPVVTLLANGAVRADVAVGQPVTLSGVVEVPPKAGSVVAAQWDFDGKGDYPVAGEVKLADAAGARATVSTTYTFPKPGTYFPALRVMSQRRPDKTPYGQIENLGRVRVVVK